MASYLKAIDFFLVQFYAKIKFAVLFLVILFNSKSGLCWIYRSWGSSFRWHIFFLAILVLEIFMVVNWCLSALEWCLTVLFLWKNWWQISTICRMNISWRINRIFSIITVKHHKTSILFAVIGLCITRIFFLIFLLRCINIYWFLPQIDLNHTNLFTQLSQIAKLLCYSV